MHYARLDDHFPTFQQTITHITLAVFATLNDRRKCILDDFEQHIIDGWHALRISAAYPPGRHFGLIRT